MLFRSNGVHFVFVCSDPNRAAGIVLNIRRKLGRQFAPQSARVMSERELRFGIVHDHKMAHTCGCCASADHFRFDDSDAQFFARASGGARRSNDAGANDQNVVNRRTHLRIPKQNGSRESKIKWLSALTNAEPVMLGYNLPARSATLPSKRLPTMLSCRQVSR